MLLIVQNQEFGKLNACLPEEVRILGILTCREICKNEKTVQFSGQLS